MIKEEKYEILIRRVEEDVKILGLESDHKIVGAMEYLQEIIQERKHRICGSGSKVDKTVARFFVIFSKEYKKCVGQKFTDRKPADGPVIKALCEKLRDNLFSVEEYLEWFFNEFIGRSEKLFPGVRLACSNNVVDQYLYSNKDLTEKRQKVEDDVVHSKQVMARGRDIARTNPEHREYIVKSLKEFYRENKITVDELEERLDKIEKENE